MARQLEIRYRPTLIELTAKRSEIQLAADEGLGMLVMEAYGQSRIREGLFRGATREMLRPMTVPTFMSH
ncbi:hypothetical protein XH98_14025 [Bradyrhizobium sp. CCBAU 51745]|uniref:hypothetical protein n=1 Tax=Bradyrhizobium sp. CCBAU 51745 TaxID=1325099 RepID=UPI002305F16E|nr:hypothetical protein [Bradyrhizobium sp. CCBAU 51745]MDA9440217.1 hypothetical protein [Bradyrhizobium sp. CCBAU 51745]